MKDNNNWVGGHLRKDMQPTWANFFVKYAKECLAEGLPLWGFTVENEPHGNGNNWESMHYSPDEMTEFVKEHLGPALETNGLGQLNILGYDQNRAGLDEWTASMYRDEESAKYFAGTAIHWYESTYDVFADDLDRAHDAVPTSSSSKPKGASMRRCRFGKTTTGTGKRKPPTGASHGARKREILAPQVLPGSPLRPGHHRMLEPLGARLGRLEHGAGPAGRPQLV